MCLAADDLVNNKDSLARLEVLAIFSFVEGDLCSFLLVEVGKGKRDGKGGENKGETKKSGDWCRIFGPRLLALMLIHPYGQMADVLLQYEY